MIPAALAVHTAGAAGFFLCIFVDNWWVVYEKGVWYIELQYMTFLPVRWVNICRCCGY